MEVEDFTDILEGGLKVSSRKSQMLRKVVGRCELSPAWFFYSAEGRWKWIFERLWELTMSEGYVAESGLMSEEGPKLQGESLME